jgi:hypothetical protein
MPSPFMIPFLLALALSGPAVAQEHHQREHGASSSKVHTPYAGLHRRSIKALSDQQISDLRADAAWAWHSRPS